LLYLFCHVGGDVAAKKSSLPGAAPHSLNSSQVLFLQALPFIVLPAIKSGGYFLATGLVDYAYGQPGKSKGIRFSF